MSSTHITETGRIVAIDSQGLWVETIRQTTCQSCSAQKGCGHGLLNSVGKGQAQRMRVQTGGSDNKRFAVNDSVEISVPSKVVVNGALLVYLLPLVTMLTAAVLTSYWVPGDVAAALSASLGFMGGILIVFIYSRINSNNPDLQPVILRHIPHSSGPSAPSLISWSS